MSNYTPCNTVFEIKNKITDSLKNSANASVRQTPGLDASLIMCHVLGCGRTDLIADRNMELSVLELEKIENCVRQRMTGLPIAYITGEKEFYGYEFYVNQDVLIPKPDTETLVEKALEWVQQNRGQSNLNHIDFCDICTGSGCIGITMVKELKAMGVASHCDCTDISPKALAVAEKNRDRLLGSEGLEKINFYTGDLCNALPENKKYNMILTNPPYVPKSVTVKLLEDGRSEPALALDGDTDTFTGKSESDDGLAIIKRLCLQAESRLFPGGVLFLEAGEYNIEEASKYFSKNGFVDIKIHKDLSGLLRVLEAHKG